ncbi:RHS repeat-associated core domain-containing protein [Streptacidiphilus sp. P02-A3a]|uniref:RHS repeat-associated core domain-containing protein n=1 Tax=Streptacidiphilus sp. P02-A3a TaxID=2704468 RepID=UPI0015FCB3F6|nr:RHS repeat-associated core domain-containing protein [Streptacidiphilus sp. P02-A3a]QMU70664.1 hypothetical protein GXP74_23120 [Streptacidiphilus sp. P02-A3a]
MTAKPGKAAVAAPARPAGAGAQSAVSKAVMANIAARSKPPVRAAGPAATGVLAKNQAALAAARAAGLIKPVGRPEHPLKTAPVPLDRLPQETSGDPAPSPLAHERYRSLAVTPDTKTYGATYAPASSFAVAPTYDSPGYMHVEVTNTGNFTWAANTIQMGYHLYYSNGSVDSYVGLSTLINVAVPAGYKVDVYSSLQELTTGSYKLVWDLIDDTDLSGTGWFTSFGVPASQAVAFTVPHYPPSGEFFAPADGATVGSTDPELEIEVLADGSEINTAEYQVCTDYPNDGTCWNSGWQAVPWTQGSFAASADWWPPEDVLSWNTTYYWEFRVQDASATTPWSSPSSFIPAPTPPAFSQLGQGGQTDPAGVGMFLGNYTASATDLTFAVPGFSLPITRYYNSLNTADGVFGPGWSSVLDMSRSIDVSTDTVTVTFPDGREVTYGENPNGTFVAGAGETSEGRMVDLNTLIMSGATYGFSSKDGKLSTITPIATPGSQITVARDSSDNAVALDAQAGPEQRELTITYSPGDPYVNAMQTTGMSAPWMYGFEGGNLATVCDPRTDLSACTQYTYNASNLLATIERPNGTTETTRIAYTSGGTVASVEQAVPGQNTWTYARIAPYDQNAALTVHVTDPRGTNVYYEFDAAGRLWSRWLTNPTPTAGLTSEWAYDPYGDVSGTSDEDANGAEYLWDPDGWLDTYDVPRDAKTTVYTNWQHQTFAGSTPLAATDPRFGLVTAIIDGNDHTSTMTYTPSGELATSTSAPTKASPNGATTSYRYTCDGGAAAPPVVNDPDMPAGTPQACGLLESVTDPDGHVTSYGYDHLGDQAQIVTPTGETTNILHDDLGEITSRTVIDSTNPTGATTTYTYDPDGRVKTETDPAALNPVTGVTHQLVTTNTYDADGNLVQTVAADATAAAAGGDAARTTTYTYDGLGDKTSTAVNGATISWARFNAFGQQVWSGDGFYTGNTLKSPSYSYDYNAVGDLTSVVMNGFVDYSTSPPTMRAVTLESYTYDPAGLLETYTDALGHTVSYTYTLDNLKASESYLNYTPYLNGPVSSQPLHQYTYDTAGNLIQDTAGTGATARTTTDSYDGNNSLLSTTLDPGGLNRTTSYSYDPDGLALSQTLSNGTQTQTTQNAYTASGQLWQTEQLNNATPNLVTTYTRDSAGLVLGSTTPLGSNAFGSSTAPDAARTTTNTYDQLDRLSTSALPQVATENGSGAAAIAQDPTATRGYDTFGDVTDIKDADGNVTHYTYDAFGHCVEIDYPSTTEPNGSVLSPTEKYAYDNNGNVLSYTDKLGQTTTYAYDTRNRPYQITMPPATAGAAAGVEKLTWDDGGNLLSVVDPTGAQTLYVYDSNERLAEKTSVVRNGTSTPNQYTTTYQYDQFGDLIKQTASAAQTSATYDNAGEVATSTQSGRGTTSYTYDVAGNVLQVTDPLGRRVVNSYDQAGRPTGSTSYDPSGNVTATSSVTTDPDGDITAVTDPEGKTWSASYDADDQLVARTDPATPSAPSGARTGFGYDADGNQTRTTDANGNATLQTYDALGDVVTQELPATAAASTSANRTITTSYNTAGQPVATTQPGGVTTSAAYDNLGRLATMSGSGAEAPTATKQFGYDLDGRLTSFSSPTYGTETLTYDDRGLVTGASTPAADGLSAATYQASYDANGRLSSQTDSTGTSTYTYSGVDDLASETDTLTGTTYAYSYDTDGELTGEKDTTAGVTGPSYTVGYDGSGNATTLSAFTPSGAANGTLAYTYDPNRNVTSKVGTGVYGSEGSQAYTYDAADRLTSTTTPATGTATDTQTYTWDPVGNRLSTTDVNSSGTSTTATTYDQRDEPLTSTSATSTTSYAWSPRGTLSSITNTPSGGTATATDAQFDAFNRLITLGSANYSYDALDRLEQTGGSGTGTGKPAQYAAGALAPSTVGGWNLARGPGADGTAVAGEPTATGSSPVSLLSDLHGDVIGALNPATGAQSASQTFGPFGQRTGTTGAAGGLPPTGFQGDYTDPGTGMVYAQSRWYDPTLGDFISADTDPPATADALDTNLYAYADDNPVSMSDPSGHSAVGALLGDVDSAFEGIVSGLQDIEGAGAGAFASVEGFTGATADAAIDGLAAGGLAVAEGTAGTIACIVGCAELVAGAIMVVAIGGIAYELTVNADGTSTYDGVYNPPGTNTPSSTPGSPATGTTTPGSQIAPPPPPPVTVIGTSLTSTSRSWTTVSKWYDSTYLYTRTDTYTQTTDILTTYFSDGSSKWISWLETTDSWTIAARLLINLSNPIDTRTPKPGKPLSPGANPNIAGDGGSQTCGDGGSIETCAGVGSTPLPPGASGDNGRDVDQSDTVSPSRARTIPPGFYLDGQGNYVSIADGTVYCGPGNAGNCVPATDPTHPDYQTGGGPDGPPQGLTSDQFAAAAALVRAGAGHLGDNIVVQGSRAAGTARPESDIDFAIRVSPERFDELIQERFGSPNPDSAKERTMEWAMRTGKIQAGEAGVGGIRRALAAQLGMDVDLSVVRQGGPFDNPPFIEVP